MNFIKYPISLLLFSLFSGLNILYGQTLPLGSVFFQNEYIINPAIIAEENRININTSLKGQLTKEQGAPVFGSFSAEFGMTDRVGLGLTLATESSGLIKRTTFRGSYAYRLPMGNSEQLDFGLSGGFLNEKIDIDKFRGDITDGSIYNFNQRPMYFDFDFGLAYQSEFLSIQASIPNLKEYLKKDLKRNSYDQLRFYSSVGYRSKFYDNPMIDYIEYKIAYRAIENNGGIFDMGINLRLNEGNFSINSVYHSSKNLTIGFATSIKKSLELFCYYNSNFSKTKNYSNGTIELGIKYSIFRKD